jgi:hypothetical protein
MIFASPDKGAGNSRVRQALLLVLLSVLIALGILELVARAMFPAPLPWLYPQVRYRPDPDLIFSLVPRQVAFTADKFAVINERGLRGRVIPFERRPGTLRLLFLGDSIGFGYGVTEDNTTAASCAGCRPRMAGAPKASTLASRLTTRNRKSCSWRSADCNTSPTGLSSRFAGTTSVVRRE